MPEGKICNGCGRIFRGTGPRCSSCDVPRVRNRKVRDRDSLERKVYHSKEWKLVRALALLRDDHECVRCGSEKDLVIHHHEEVGSGVDPYDLDNLETLCRRCHGKEHAARKRNSADIQ